MPKLQAQNLSYDVESSTNYLILNLLTAQVYFVHVCEPARLLRSVVGNCCQYLAHYC